MQTHEDWMRLAWQLASATTGQTGSNPMVGAVVVNEGRVVGLGAHLQAGTAHAEVHALQMAGEQAVGGTIYVTLEPCNHYGKTPPCTEAILKAGLHRVVVGSLDPDPQVCGQGIAKLRAAGLEVITDVYSTACQQLNEAYFHHRMTSRPFVTLKMAMTLDGKIATQTGDSRWITNKASRQRVHELRHQYEAILVGIGTVLADDPALTARLAPGGRHPLRLIVDSQLRLPLNAQVAQTDMAPTWVFTTEKANPEKRQQLEKQGVRVIACGPGPHVDLNQLLQIAGDEGLLSILIEGGSAINAAFLHGDHVQKVIAFLAPKLLGGKESLSAITGHSPEKMASARELHSITIDTFGDNICITGYLTEKVR